MPERLVIQTCREQHVILQQLVSRVPSSLPFDADACSAVLTRLRIVLVRHLELEDDRLYPRLAELDDPTVSEKACRYQEEMGSLRRAFTDFSTKWSETANIAGDPSGFLQHWAQIKEALLKRIAAEDTDLYEDAERALKH